MDEDHYQQVRRDDHLATVHIQDHAIEARAKLHNRLRIPLNVVEKGHKSRERVRDRVGAAVAIENINHFKSLAVKTRTSVLEKKAKPPILDSNPELTLPIATGLRI
jgi:hypothetical protein